MESRTERLLPNGIPRWIRCYDNGGETCDRYTVIFTGRYRHQTGGEGWGLGMSTYPFDPQGFGQHFGWTGQSPDVSGSSWGGPAIGRKCHLGTRIAFDTMPPDCQRATLDDYRELWNLN